MKDTFIKRITEAANASNNVKTPLTQFSTLQALMSGDYYATASVGELLNCGDIGIGTFEHLDGEMIILDGVCYRVRGDGAVEQVKNEETVPFCVITKFREDYRIHLPSSESAQALKNALDREIQCLGDNYFYICRISGTFQSVQARSILSQREPYRPMSEVLKYDERKFFFRYAEGTLICVRFPDYMAGVNASGWHIHFISADKTRGGHLLNLCFAEAEASLQKINDFSMRLPNNPFFQKAALTKISEESIRNAEQ